MPNGFMAVAFDVDAAGLASLREALPDWEIEALKGATATSLTYDWRPGEADLLIVQAREKVAESLSLCRFLVSWGLCFRGEGAAMMGLHEGRQGLLRGGEAPLLVLASAGQKAFVKAAFEAGAHSCLVLP